MRSDFDSLNLHPDLRRAIDDLGFTQMTPIQQKVLRYTLAGHDAIGRAQTGTGKTAAFLISVINDLLNHPVADQRYRGEPRALILAPTRELALQIESDAKHLTKHRNFLTRFRIKIATKLQEKGRGQRPIQNHLQLHPMAPPH